MKGSIMATGKKAINKWLKIEKVGKFTRQIQREKEKR
jgi:hypothetical protein